MSREPFDPTDLDRKPRDDGGPAIISVTMVGSSMSLRDYFAGQALSGMLSAHGVSRDPLVVASEAYIYADALLVERAKP